VFSIPTKVSNEKLEVNIAPVLEDFLVMIRVKVKGFSNSHQICA
jgi:hypothetical protein